MATSRRRGDRSAGGRNAHRPTGRRGVRDHWRALVRAASWHRRKLAAVCAVAAVLTGLTALAPPRPDTVPSVRATSDLAGGTVLRPADVRLDHLPRDALPAGAVTDPDLVVGKTLAGRVPSGQVLATAHLVGGRFRGGSGQVIAPVRLADGDLTALLTDGDLVDVVGADEQTGRATVVASGVRVVAVPPAARDPASAAGGGLILVEVARSTATALASASAASQLSVVWR
jgi:pilus assembly protein CpaB